MFRAPLAGRWPFRRRVWNHCSNWKTVLSLETNREREEGKKANWSLFILLMAATEDKRGYLVEADAVCWVMHSCFWHPNSRLVTALISLDLSTWVFFTSTPPHPKRPSSYWAQPSFTTESDMRVKSLTVLKCFLALTVHWNGILSCRIMSALWTIIHLHDNHIWEHRIVM